jgi:hypothetical protein
MGVGSQYVHRFMEFYHPFQLDHREKDGVVFIFLEKKPIEGANETRSNGDHDVCHDHFC